MKRKQRSAGFSLPELLAAILIGSIVIAALFRFALPAIETVSAVDARLTADNNGHVALSHLRSVLRRDGHWQCQDPSALFDPLIGGANWRPQAGDLAWPAHLSGVADDMTNDRLGGNDVLWIGQHVASAGSVCESVLSSADVYYLATNIAGRPALFRQQVLPEPGRRQEIVSGVVAMNFRFAVSATQSTHWQTADSLTEQTPAEGVYIELVVSEPVPGGSTHHSVRSFRGATEVTTDRPSVVRAHSTSVVLPDGYGSRL